jgi:hemoglobin
MNLYDELGGDPGVTAAVDNFYARVLDDPTLVGWFVDIDLARLKDHQRAFLSVALGGPEEYTVRSMRVAHHGLAISTGAYSRLLGHLVDALVELGASQPVVELAAKRIGALRPAIVEGP